MMTQNGQLTDKEQVALDYLRGWVEKHGYSPTYDDLCKELDFRTGALIWYEFRGLEDQGYLSIIKTRADRYLAESLPDVEGKVELGDSRVAGTFSDIPKARFVVTSLRRDECKAKYLYEKVYCARGEMENRIKECQLDLYADRTSAATMRANQLRLCTSAPACARVPLPPPRRYPRRFSQSRPRYCRQTPCVSLP